MSPETTATYAALQDQIEDLRNTLESIRDGGVDAVITGLPGDEQIYSLTSADRPYRLLVETMNEGALTVSDRGVVVYANARMVELVGRDPRTLVGSLAADLVVPEDREAFANLLKLAPGELDSRGLTLVGSEDTVSVLAAASCLDIEDTRVHCFVITDLRGQQAATLDLKRSNQDLEQFAYAASHDLAEPLRAISLPITLLSRRYAGQLDEDADTYIGFIVDGCARMQQMIDSLLVYSRVGRLESDLQPVDLSVVLADVLGLLAGPIEERGAVVTSHPLPTVVAEPAQMTQIFQNLLANSLKFVVADTTPVIEVGVEQRGSMWRFTVDDNGIGIDPAQRDRVFGMFKRLHPHEEYPGTGIGLALVKKVVERYRGEVGVDDTPTGTGCRFWFTLPVVPDGPAG